MGSLQDENKALFWELELIDETHKTFTQKRHPTF